MIVETVSNNSHVPYAVVSDVPRNLEEITSAVNLSAALSNATLPMPAYFTLSYRAVAFCLYAAIVLTGVLGNIMVILVVSKSISMHTPTNCYLVSLAFADICTLLASSLPNMVECFAITNSLYLC